MPRRPTAGMVGGPAPAFDLTTIGGRSFSSAELAASKATVINFFAGNDPFSQKQLPRVEAVRRQWERRGVRFVNVSQTMRNQRFSNAQLVEMMKRLGVQAELVADPNNQAGPAFQATSYPSLFVVGSNGVIEFAIIGNAADLEQRLETELTIALDPAAVALRAAQRAALPSTAVTTRPARGPVQHVGARTFYQVGERWLDSAYKDEMTTKKVEAFSEDYFKLTRDHPELGPCFAIGQRVVVVFEGTAYEVVVPDGV